MLCVMRFAKASEKKIKGTGQAAPPPAVSVEKEGQCQPGNGEDQFPKTLAPGKRHEIAPLDIADRIRCDFHNSSEFSVRRAQEGKLPSVGCGARPEISFHARMGGRCGFRPSPRRRMPEKTARLKKCITPRTKR